MKRHFFKSSLIFLVLSVTAFYALGQARFEPAKRYASSGRSFTWEVSTLEKGRDSINTRRHAGFPGQDYADAERHRLTLPLISDETPDWSPFSGQDGDVTNLLYSGLYAFYMNEERTGYAIVPEMAAAMPVDVTAEYAGRLGVAAGETGKAWRIVLNRDAMWSLTAEAMNRLSDADLDFNITADDYIYSLKQLLNPEKNYSHAAEMALIYNAGPYSRGGHISYAPLETSAEEALADGLKVCLDMDFFNLTGAMDAEGNAAPQYLPIDDDTHYQDADGDYMSAKSLYEDYLQSGKPYESYQWEYLRVQNVEPVINWAEVGIQKVDDYTIDFILTESLRNPEFQLPWLLRESFPVCEPLYEADPESYGRGLDGTASCGPYMMKECSDDGILLTRDDMWYGYRDGRHKGLYQTDECLFRVFTDHEAAKAAFEAGEIDMVEGELEGDEGENVYRIPEDYVVKLTFNTNYEKLLEHGMNSQIIAVDEFREALARGLDFDASGLIGETYICNPCTGETYRQSAAGRRVKREERDTNYARHLMQTAYDKAVAAGIYDGISNINLELRVFRDDAKHRALYEAVNTQLKSLCQGTALESLISMTMISDPDCYGSATSGDVDMLFSAWGGSPLDPYGLFARCYTDSAAGEGLQLEYGYDTTEIELIINDMAASLRDWALWIDGGDVPSISESLGSVSEYTCATRAQILAGIESCYLNWHADIPLYQRCSALKVKDGIVLGSDQYINPAVGFGGVAYIHYR